jgi:hypothetical protein
VKGPRYKVATVSGYATIGKGFRRHGPGLSAHVLDTLYGCQVLASFRSEDATGTRADGSKLSQARRRGRDGAVIDAEARAAELNAELPFPNRRAPAKVPPDETTTRVQRGRV